MSCLTILVTLSIRQVFVHVPKDICSEASQGHTLSAESDLQGPVVLTVLYLPAIVLSELTPRFT